MMLMSYLGDYRSLSGARTSRERPVRLVYMDEAGVSNPKEEPYLVVSGVILDGDQDWVPVDRHIKHLARKHVPEDDQVGIVFHAMEIFHGERQFPRSQLTREKRWRLLTDLAKTPAKFHLTVVNGFVHRASAAEAIRRAVPGMTEQAIASVIHAQAYVYAANAVDRWMERNARSEVAMLVMEKSDRIQQVLKLLHAGFTTDHVDDYWFDQEYRKYFKRLAPEPFKTRRIIDTVHFAAKEESPLLQIADTCAFLVKRALMKKEDCFQFFDLLAPQLYPPAKPDGARLRPSQIPMRKPLAVTIPDKFIKPVEE
jgi:hypothetical protein